MATIFKKKNKQTNKQINKQRNKTNRQTKQKNKNKTKQQQTNKQKAADFSWFSSKYEGPSVPKVTSTHASGKHIIQAFVQFKGLIHLLLG